MTNPQTPTRPSESQTQKALLYNGSIEIHFDPKTHSYFLDGIRIPGVTETLKILSKPALIPWAVGMACEAVLDCWKPGKTYTLEKILESVERAKRAYRVKRDAASYIGAECHDWIRRYIKEKRDIPFPEDPTSKEVVSRFVKFANDNDLEFIESERILYSRTFGYAGTTDFIAKSDGRLFVGEIKTASGIYVEASLQSAAYRYAYAEEHSIPKEDIDNVIVRIGKEGDFETLKISGDESDEYMEVFLGLLKAFKILNKKNLM